MISNKTLEINKRRLVLVFFGILISFIKNQGNNTQVGGLRKNDKSCYKEIPSNKKNKYTDTRYEGANKLFVIIKYMWECQGYINIFKPHKWGKLLSQIKPLDIITKLFPGLFYISRFAGIVVLSLFLILFSFFAVIFDIRISLLSDFKFVDFLLSIWKIFTLSWIVNSILMATYIYKSRKLIEKGEEDTTLSNLIGYGGLDEFIKDQKEFKNTYAMIIMTFIYSFYYNIVGLSTVGFGDIYPKGLLPRIILIYYALFLVTGMSAGFYKTNI